MLGGGPGGIGAAIAAAREGKDVLLVDHYGYLGGMASVGEVNPFMPNHLDGDSLDQGIYTEWADRISYYTDDGDLAAMANCPFELGRETSSAVQPMTMCFKLRLCDEDLSYIGELSQEKPAIQFAKLQKCLLIFRMLIWWQRLM